MVENYLSPYVRSAAFVWMVLLATWHVQAQSPTKLIYTQQGNLATSSDQLLSASLTGTFPATGTPLATGPSSFTQPNDVVFDPVNNFIYVVDNIITSPPGTMSATVGTILRYSYNATTNAASNRTVIVSGTTNATYQGLALDITNDRLYFSQSSATNSLDAIKVVSGIKGSTFTVAQLIDGQPANGNFANPRGVAFDPVNKFLYVIDQFINTGPILRFTVNTNNNTVSNRVEVVTGVGAGTTSAYGGLALDQVNDRLYFTQYRSAQPSVKNVEDALKVVSGVSGAGPFTVTELLNGLNPSVAFLFPQDLVLDRENNYLYLVDQVGGGGAIYRYTIAGTDQTTIVGPASVSASYGGVALNGGVFSPVSLTSSTPSDGATGVSPTTNIVLNFNRVVNKGTGNFEIRRTSDNTVVETLPVTSSQVTGSGTTWTIDPSITLAPGTTYALRAASGIFTTTDGGSFTGIATNTTLNFTTNATPVINPQSFTVNENAPNSIVVGAVVASDPDPGTTLSYAILSGNTNGAFTLVGNSLRVANSAALNFETTSTFSLSIQVSDGTLVSSAPVTVNVNNANELAVSITARTDVNCNGGSDGTATATATGETPPYSYNWRNNTTNTTLAQTTSAVTGLTAGIYSLTVTASGFTATTSFTISQPTALSLTSSQTRVSTLGGSDGTATVNVSGGTPSYSYNWAPGNPTGDGTNSISSLTAGLYSLTVTDSKGCTAATSVTVTTAPDLTPILYARPSTQYNTTDFTLVVDVLELNNVATSGLITVKLTKDSQVMLTLNSSLTVVEGRSVQNSAWNFLDSDPNYYVLTSTQTVAASNKLSFGLNGKSIPGATTGTLTNSATLTGASGGEIRLINNNDADKIEYFQQ